MVDIIDFEDDDSEEILDNERLVQITIKVNDSTREMFSKISKRERRTMSQLGAIIVENYVKEYIEEYKKKQENVDKPKKVGNYIASKD